MRYRGRERELSGAEPLTTNNRMELMAAIQALEALSRSCRVRLTTDSQYLCKGIGEWLPRWRTSNWKTANRTPVKNADLWQRLDTAARRHEVEWVWTRGHSGHPENERADRLARCAIDALAPASDERARP